DRRDRVVLVVQQDVDPATLLPRGPGVGDFPLDVSTDSADHWRLAIDTGTVELLDCPTLCDRLGLNAVTLVTLVPGVQGVRQSGLGRVEASVQEPRPAAADLFGDTPARRCPGSRRVGVVRRTSCRNGRFVGCLAENPGHGRSFSG